MENELDKLLDKAWQSLPASNPEFKKYLKAMSLISIGNDEFAIECLKSINYGAK